MSLKTRKSALNVTRESLLRLTGRTNVALRFNGPRAEGDIRLNNVGQVQCIDHRSPWRLCGLKRPARKLDWECGERAHAVLKRSKELERWVCRKRVDSGCRRHPYSVDSLGLRSAKVSKPPSHRAIPGHFFCFFVFFLIQWVKKGQEKRLWLICRRQLSMICDSGRGHRR